LKGVADQPEYLDAAAAAAAAAAAPLSTDIQRPFSQLRQL